jgi:mandelate racemase
MAVAYFTETPKTETPGNHTPEVAAHVMRVTETAHWLEWQDWADPVLQKPYEIGDGLLHIPEVPGVGLEWNEEAVAANLANL